VVDTIKAYSASRNSMSNTSLDFCAGRNLVRGDKIYVRTFTDNVVRTLSQRCHNTSNDDITTL
jgi:hypothetical protein